MASNLIQVDFLDETNYISVSDGSDIVGVVADTNWGPVGVPTVCNSSVYRTLFNPQGLGRLNSSLATVTRVFEMGASYVEVVRLGKDTSASEPWVFFSIDSTGKLTADAGFTYANDAEATDFNSVIASENNPIKEGSVAAFRLRYPGGFPMRVSLSSSKTFMTKQLFTLTLSAFSGFTYDSSGKSTPSFNNTLETLSFTLEELEASGVSYFYADQISNNSAYFTTDITWAYSNESKYTTSSGAVASSFTNVGMGDIQGYSVSKGSGDVEMSIPTYSSSAFVSAYKLFGDRDISSSTLLVSSFIPSMDSGKVPEAATSATGGFEDYASVLSAMSSVSEARKDCNSLVGFPTITNTYYWKPKGGASDTGTRANAVAWFNSADISNAGLRMFTSGIVGWETYTLRTTLGVKRFDLDCTAAWAGRICATAYALHNRNQLPSYKAYGSFSGSLVRTLDFDTVVAMHDEDGIGSVYSSAVGNYIFCIRDLYGAGESYFARLNVMRVTAALLSQTFDMVEDVIHTDVAANRTNRLALEGRLNTLLGNFAARQELKVESYANVGDELNSDVNTNGGRYLRIQLVCYFMSLTEKVFITVVARDGSVSADVSMSA
jgi:hypothetical protein|nr:MAG TPA: hypothetical protein [Caudoviricetes sp.]